MATFNSAVFTSQSNSGGAGASADVGFLLSRDVEGKGRLAIVSYTALGSEVTNDLVQLIQLPPGAKLIPSKSQIEATATVGTGVTVRVGDQTTANRFAGTIDISAGGHFPYTNTLGTDVIVPVAVVGVSTNPMTADNIVTLKFVAVTAITAGKIITNFIEYVLPSG